MKPARILIVSGAALSRNPRVLKEAGTLASAGYDVTVLTLRNHATAEEFDRNIMGTAQFKRIVLDVAAAPGASPLQVYRRRFKAAGTRWLARRLGRQSIETIGPAGELLAIARREQADLTIGHTEVGLWVVAKLLAEGRKVAADLEDWHSEDLPPADRVGRPVRLLRSLECELLRGAAYTTTVGDALADALHQACGGQRPTVISNSFPLQPNPRQGPSGHPPAFFWFSQTLGPNRGLEAFLNVWNLMAVPSRIVFMGEDRQGFRDVLLALVPAPRRTMLEFVDLVPPDELPAIISRHDVGLALETSATRNRDLAVTNKTLHYLNAGLAIAATATTGQREVLARNPAAGVLLDLNPVVAAATLDRLIRDQEVLRSHQLAARQLAESHYCWEKESPSLLNLVAQALAT